MLRAGPALARLRAMGRPMMPPVSGVQRACKPGSVAKTGQARSPDGHSSGPGVAPWFSRPTTAAARKPALSRRGRNTLRYLGLLRVGFTLPLPLLVARCALTAPFHPYLDRSRWRFAFCGTFPELPLAGRYPAPCFRGARTFLTNPKRASATIQPSAGPSPQPRQARCKALLAARKLR